MENIKEDDSSGSVCFQGMVGCSQKIKEVFHLIENIAPSNSSVLILGESGTGKELTARALHELSQRQSKPFVVINCSALPETLLESELFGHEKGSYTGAYTDKRGLFAEADGGTIFLDEIGEITLPVQVKLLRVLQNGDFRKVGGEENIHVDVRIVAATNSDLQEMVKRKKFREDLFYRLNVISLVLPPLRDRPGDVPLLASCFLKKFSERSGKKVIRIAEDSLQAFQKYPWPGNVRELENVMERAVVLSESDTVTVRDLPPRLLSEVFYVSEKKQRTQEREEDWFHLPYQEAKQKALNLFNRAYISNLLKEARGNVSTSSEKAGMDRSNFKKIIKKCDLNIKDFKKKDVSL